MLSSASGRTKVTVCIVCMHGLIAIIQNTHFSVVKYPRVQSFSNVSWTGQTDPKDWQCTNCSLTIIASPPSFNRRKSRPEDTFSAINIILLFSYLNEIACFRGARSLLERWRTRRDELSFHRQIPPAPATSLSPRAVVRCSKERRIPLSPSESGSCVPDAHFYRFNSSQWTSSGLRTAQVYLTPCVYNERH